MPLCSLLNTSRKGVQAARIPGPLSSPADSLFPARNQRSAGFLVSITPKIPRIKINLDGSIGPVCSCSARVLGPKANPDYALCKASH
jgi:hypothetical protein